MNASKELAATAINKDFTGMMSDPVEGIFCELVDESNVFNWRIYIEGPSSTPYAGGIYTAEMSFPDDYPMSPPVVKFISNFWHPNVYPDGKVCISILHPPGEDDMSGERPEERWNPTQTVSTILLSIISLLSDPNISSPANVDASVEYRNKIEEFRKRVSKLNEQASSTVPAHVRIPHPDTDPEERARRVAKLKLETEQMEPDYEDFDMDMGDMDVYFDSDDYSLSGSDYYSDNDDDSMDSVDPNNDADEDK